MLRAFFEDRRASAGVGEDMLSIVIVVFLVSTAIAGLMQAYANHRKGVSLIERSDGAIDLAILLKDRALAIKEDLDLDVVMETSCLLHSSLDEYDLKEVNLSIRQWWGNYLGKGFRFHVEVVDGEENILYEFIGEGDDLRLATDFDRSRLDRITQRVRIFYPVALIEPAGDIVLGKMRVSIWK